MSPERQVSDPRVEPLAFSAKQVTKLTGLSLGQLKYWDDTRFFSPEYAPDGRRGAFTRIYSFRDVVGLYAVALLRKRHGFSLQELRPVGEYLHRNYEAPWARLAFYVSGRNVYFRSPEEPDAAPVGVRPLGQIAMPVEMVQIANEVLEATVRMRRRQRDQLGRLERNRYVVRNAMVIAGTRIPTAAIRDLHEARYSTDQIISEYPRLTPVDVQAALAFETGPGKRRSAKRR
jgi:uncharacterized protein (DUF433 family)